MVMVAGDLAKIGPDEAVFVSIRRIKIHKIYRHI
jgi:hypothetical protein